MITKDSYRVIIYYDDIMYIASDKIYIDYVSKNSLSEALKSELHDNQSKSLFQQIVNNLNSLANSIEAMHVKRFKFDDKAITRGFVRLDWSDDDTLTAAHNALTSYIKNTVIIKVDEETMNSNLIVYDMLQSKILEGCI